MTIGTDFAARRREVVIKQLRAFLAIGGTGSSTRGSETLHLVQPALSRQLRMLEDELGTTLFERTPRGMDLTDAGARLNRADTSSKREPFGVSVSGVEDNQDVDV